MSVIGIDPSLSATGIATSSGWQTVRTEAGDSLRLQKIHMTVRLAAKDCDLAVIEDLPTHAQGAGLTGMAQGVVRLALIEAAVPYVTVAAATLKKFATGKGNCTKPDMRMAWFQRTGLDVRDDNQVDALWLHQLGLHLIACDSRLTLPQTHLVALAKVKLPIPVM